MAYCASGCKGRADAEQEIVREEPVVEPVRRAPMVRAVRLARGQTLTDLLSDVGLPVTDQLVTELHRVFDPRRLRPGTVVAYATTPTDSQTAGVMLDDTVVRARFQQGVWYVTRDSIPLLVDTVLVGAELEAGESVMAAADRAISSLPPINRAVLVAEFVELYRNQINFRRDMREGDRFAVMATRWLRPDGSVRDHQILAAALTIRQDAHYRVFFSHRQGAGYFPPDGQAVRASLTRFPTRTPRITSSFNLRRRHPVLGIVRPHFGVDLYASPNTPIRSVGDGTVTRAGRVGGYGTAVFINHGGGAATRYAHLARVAPGIVPGRRIRRGETIGFSGSTGNSAGPHLHFEVLLDGRPVDPTTTRLPTDEPVTAEAVAAFADVVRERMPLIEAAVTRSGQPAARTTATPSQ
jgi:murein DD-endopeptidase MepM/ murein hydrolase activator NlpD